jgi:hypothetical protein
VGSYAGKYDLLTGSKAMESHGGSGADVLSPSSSIMIGVGAVSTTDTSRKK